MVSLVTIVALAICALLLGILLGLAVLWFRYPHEYDVRDVSTKGILGLIVLAAIAYPAIFVTVVHA